MLIYAQPTWALTREWALTIRLGKTDTWTLTREWALARETTVYTMKNIFQIINFLIL